MSNGQDDSFNKYFTTRYGVAETVAMVELKGMLRTVWKAALANDPDVIELKVYSHNVRDGVSALQSLCDKGASDKEARDILTTVQRIINKMNR